ncbi:hypothetical protein PN492_13570 [Dolichospermum circinale CS-537/01]|uniref:Uncharacterized protein n=1 Tax=Dolichospermum circinale CS-537/01 TaxID=3021739 RepID=A0ABT5A7V9_9CYAN|nr:hypothetical protein [Dolichospermum circinale]MDB9487564.1 hypothetical protein [Dolichospermum circinale CS-537/01]
MRIKTIAVGYTRKFNLENYNSLELHTHLWASIGEDENEEACIEILHDKCRESVRREYLKYVNKSKPVPTFTINSGGEYVTEDITEM